MFSKLCRLSNILGVGLVAVSLGACAPMSAGGGRTASSLDMSERHIGAVTVKQSRTVDREVTGRNADQYFFTIYNALEAGKPGFAGTTEPLELQIRDGEEILWSQTVMPNAKGWAKVMLEDPSIVTTTSNFCIKTPWPIAHQRKRPAFAKPGEYFMCQAGLYDYLISEGRGKTRSDAYGVIAIEAAG